MPTLRLAWRSLSLAALFVVLTVRSTQAGCGCDKPPPAPAEVRPNVTYAGTPVTLFSPVLQVGQEYSVTFASGISGETATVRAPAVLRRDLADGQFRPQLVVALPRMPLGPASIMVTGTTGVEVVFVADADFTVAPDPVALPARVGAYHFQNFQAAVGRDGVAYVALDLSQLTGPLIFDVQALGYPMRFSEQDLVFHNIQGFLMQLLVTSDPKGTKTEPIPGMFVLPAANPASDSDTLHYSRHEFDTYFMQHQERLAHALDPADANWHLDGTRHIDHNHLILAMMGHLNNGTLPVPGATAPFDLSVRTYSLFSEGVVGGSGVAMSGSAVVNGGAFTNGKVSLSSRATINGDATATEFNLSGTSAINGNRYFLTRPMTFMQVEVPSGLTDLGTIDLSGATRSITGPGSFRVTNLAVKSGGRLFIDNSAGPVTMYVTGQVAVTGGGVIAVADPTPEKFAVYVASNKSVALTGGGSTFSGVVYAPRSVVSITGEGEFFGSFVGATVKMSNLASVRYDASLR